MKAIPRILYFVCFLGLALVGALAFNRVVAPSMATILTRAVFLATFAAVPGLIHRRLWPLTVVFLPVACYVLIRTVMPIPVTVDGASAQYHFYLEQLQHGAVLYRSTPFPLALFAVPQLTLLLSFTIFWVIGVAAFLSVSLRKALPGIIVVLALLGFSLTVDQSARAIAPAFLFLVLAACLFVLSRGLDREGWRFRNALVGAVVGAVGGVLALLLLAAAPSAAAAPWWSWQEWNLSFNQSVYTFNWLQNYPKLLDPGHNVPVMQVKSAYPSYWRANALDNFTGAAWATSQAFLVRLTGQEDGGRHVYTVPEGSPTVPGHTVTEDFSMQSASTNYLFVGGDPQSLSADREIAPRMNDMRSLRVTSALGPSTHYALTAVIPELVPEALVGLGRDYPDGVATYLTLPFSRLADLGGPDKATAWQKSLTENTPGGSEWLELYSLNQRIVGDASDPYQITLRVEEYLRQFYKYSLTPPASDYASPYAAFLFDTRSGYCQHFAGAMAVLLRFNGIPARVAVGFTTGEEKGKGIYQVSSNNAHAWVEVFFPTAGWVAFDPTPGRSIPGSTVSSSSAGFINPFVSSTPSGNGTPNTTMPTLPPDSQVASPSGGQSSEASWLSRNTWLAWVIGLVVVVAGWPFARRVWRGRQLRRGPWERRLQASLALLRRDLRDRGAPVTPAQTLEEVLDSIKSFLGFEPDLAFADRAEALLFGGRETLPRDFQRAEALRHDVNVHLRRRWGWIRTGLAWYGLPRSGH